MDIKVSIAVNDLPELMQKYPAAATKCTVSRIMEALKFLEREIKEATPVGAGPTHLRDTIFSKIESFGSPIRGSVGTSAIYGEAVEMGTKPHFPKAAPIQYWVENKLGLSGKEAIKVSRMIVRKIGKHGTEGAKMFTDTYTKYESAIKQILGKIPADIIREVNT